MAASAVDHGVCPHCGRADAVKRVEAVEIDHHPLAERFRCDGCGAIWAGIRRLSNVPAASGDPDTA